MIRVDGLDTGCIPADDRGLAYGDGLFETLRARGGRLPLLDEHLARLWAGLQTLRIPFPDETTLRRELLEAAAVEQEGVVKLIVTRGSGGRGYAPPAQPVSRRIVQTSPLPALLSRWQQEGMSVRFCRTPLAAGPSALAGLKHLNRLAQVIAQMEPEGSECDEGLMSDVHGHVIEGTRTNLFARFGEKLLAPPVGDGVNGIMRQLLFGLCRRAGVVVSEQQLSRRDLLAADEIFLTNSVIGVCPVRRIEDREVAIGTMTHELRDLIENELEQRAC